MILSYLSLSSDLLLGIMGIKLLKISSFFVYSFKRINYLKIAYVLGAIKFFHSDIEAREKISLYKHA